MEDGTGAVPTVVVAADTEADTGLAVGTRYLVAACRRAERMDVRGTSPSDTPDHARDRSSVGWPRRMPFHGAKRGSHRRGWSHGTRWIRHARGCGFGCGSDGASSLVRLYTGMPIDRNCARVVHPPLEPDQGEATTPKKEARRVPPSALDESTRVRGPKTQHEVITPNLARRPPQGPCRTSGADPPAPVGTAWCVAAVPAWISTKPQRLFDDASWQVGQHLAELA